MTGDDSTATSRRAVLTALGAAGSSALAGCLVSGTTRTTPDHDEQASPGGDSTPSGEQSDLRGNSEIHSAKPSGPLPNSCPEYGTDSVVCYDAVAGDTDSVAVYLEPRTRSLAPDRSIEFVLRNTSDRSFHTNFYDWRVDKYVDGEWYQVAPRGVNQPLMIVAPGGTHTWTLSVDNSDIENGTSVPWASGSREITLHGAGGGHYAFRARGWFPEDGNDSTRSLATTFTYDGEPLALTPTDGIQQTSWENETLVATTDQSDSAARRAAYELEQIENPESEPTSMIVEQVIRTEPLRNVLALAFRHGPERVRLETSDSTTPPFGLQNRRLIRFHGETFAVTARELPEETT